MRVAHIGAYGLRIRPPWRCRTARAPGRGPTSNEPQCFDSTQKAVALLDAHARKGGNLTASKPGHAPVRCAAHAGRLGCESCPARHQKLSDLGTVIHDVRSVACSAATSEPPGRADWRAVPDDPMRKCDKRANEAHPIIHTAAARREGCPARNVPSGDSPHTPGPRFNGVSGPAGPGLDSSATVSTMGRSGKRTHTSRRS